MLPHDNIEAAAVLIAEEKACVVIISHCVHMEGPFKVHTIEGRISWGGWGVGSRSGAAKLLVAHCGVGGGRDACCICPPLSAPIGFLCGNYRTGCPLHTNCQAGITVHGLNNFHALVVCSKEESPDPGAQPLLVVWSDSTCPAHCPSTWLSTTQFGSI